MADDDPVMKALAGVRVTPSVHSSLGPKLQTFTVVERGPSKPRSHVDVPPMPGGGR